MKIGNQVKILVDYSNGVTKQNIKGRIGEIIMTYKNRHCVKVEGFPNLWFYEKELKEAK